MSKCTATAFAWGVVCLVSSAPTYAADHNLEFRLVVMPVEVKTFEIANVEGQNVSLMKMAGVAFFKDGRVAAKNFVFNNDYNKGSGPFYGYSTYQFEAQHVVAAVACRSPLVEQRLPARADQRQHGVGAFEPRRDALAPARAGLDVFAVEEDALLAEALGEGRVQPIGQRTGVGAAVADEDAAGHRWGRACARAAAAG